MYIKDLILLYSVFPERQAAGAAEWAGGDREESYLI